MTKKKVFLTGGHGMVGKNILEHPVAKNWEFFAPGSKELDLADYQATLSYMKDKRPDAVIHSAGRVGGIHANMAHPVDFLVANTDLGRNIVLAARETGVKQLLNLGSSCMYPRNAPNPLKEELVLKGELEPTNEGYAIAKIYTQRLCQYIATEDASFQYKTFIPCNLYGRHDKFDPKHSHLVPAIIHKIHEAKQKGETEVEIWGDGKARREFMYAGDLADAVMKALAGFDALPSLINIGLGVDYSIDDYYAAAAEAIGWQGHFRHNLDKPVGMAQKLVSIEKQKAWGWTPKTTLREGIEKSYQFYLENFRA